MYEELIGFKQLYNDRIAILLIPKHAKRVLWHQYKSNEDRVSYKNRASEVFVLAIKDKNGKLVKTGQSLYTIGRKLKRTEYRVGRTVKPDNYDPTLEDSCTQGIHFFLKHDLAKDYKY